jgi:hypothetical protein
MRRIATLFALAACNNEPEAETQTWTALSDACIDGDNVVAMFEGCLSSSCDTEQASACTVTLDGTELNVTGEATVIHQGEECTDDCGMIEVTCALPTGSEAATTLSFGGTPVAIADAACADPG